jgi:hypothetical protein
MRWSKMLGGGAGRQKIPQPAPPGTLPPKRTSSPTFQIAISCKESGDTHKNTAAPEKLVVRAGNPIHNHADCNKESDTARDVIVFLVWPHAR